MSDFQLVLTVFGGILIFFGVINLIYQIFSASSLVLAGIICLNFAWNWFSWFWLIPFIFLCLIAITSTLFCTGIKAKEYLGNKAWLPVLGCILGAIFIPVPFIGPLLGVFLMSIFIFSNKETFNLPPEIANSNVFNKALIITFSCFLGLIIEATIIFIMLVLLLFLAIF